MRRLVPPVKITTERESSMTEQYSIKDMHRSQKTMESVKQIWHYWNIAYQPKRLESPRDSPPVARAFSYVTLVAATLTRATRSYSLVALTLATRSYSLVALTLTRATRTSPARQQCPGRSVGHMQHATDRRD